MVSRGSCDRRSAFVGALVRRSAGTSIVAAVALMLFTASAVLCQSPVDVSRTSTSVVTLAPGDVIRIDVWQQKEYSGEFPIAADGSITHPLYRELKVAGIPLPEVEARLRAFLAKYQTNPTFVIQPLLRVIVAGEVRQPNILTVPPGTTVAQAIALAGGPTERGRLDDVRLLRENGSLTIDLTRPDDSASRVEVHSGDRLVVGRRRNLLQDVIAPASSILAAAAAVTSVIIQINRK